jgi:hypothetical protein
VKVRWGNPLAAKQTLVATAAKWRLVRKADLGDTEMLRSLVNVGFRESAA